VAIVGLLAFRSYRKGLEVQERGRNVLKAMLQRLEQDGYSVDSELSGTFVAGTIIQRSETDATGALKKLRRPVVFKWAEDCFKGVSPRSATYVLEETSESSSTSLQVSGDELGESLPELRLSGNAVSKYSLSFINPHSVTFAKGDLSQKFTPECVRDYANAVRKEKPEAFAVVLSSVVVDEIRYDIEWASSADANARLAVTRKAQQALQKANTKGTMQLGVADSSSSVSHISGKGQIVLAYSARVLDPVHASELDDAGP